MYQFCINEIHNISQHHNILHKININIWPIPTSLRRGKKSNIPFHLEKHTNPTHIQDRSLSSKFPRIVLNPTVQEGNIRANKMREKQTLELKRTQKINENLQQQQNLPN